MLTQVLHSSTVCNQVSIGSTLLPELRDWSRKRTWWKEREWKPKWSNRSRNGWHFLCNYLEHTFACHLPHVHFEHGWALKVGTRVPKCGITRHSAAQQLCWGQIANHVKSKVPLPITQPYYFFRKHWELGHMTVALKNNEVCCFRANSTFAVWSLAAMAVGLAEKHSLVRSIRAAVGSINKRKFSPWRC